MLQTRDKLTEAIHLKQLNNIEKELRSFTVSEQSKRNDTDKTKAKLREPTDSTHTIHHNTDEVRRLIDNLHGRNTSSTHTITTVNRTVSAPVGNITNPVIRPTGFDSGGYTGSWNNKDGRLAFLHEKELVLNQDDTKNMLKAVNVVRDMFSGVGKGISNLGNLFPSNTNNQGQVFHIGKLEFPNVSDGEEIKNAILRLPGVALQFD